MDQRSRSGSFHRAARLGIVGLWTLAPTGCWPRPPDCLMAAPVSREEAGRPGAPASSPATADGPAAVMVGAAPVSFEVRASPGFMLRIDQAGEHQIDALGTLDPLLRVFAGDQLIATDDDGGEGTNARVVLFLERGDYRVTVQDTFGRAMLGQLEVRRLPDLEATGSLPLGQAVTVRLEAAPTPRAGARALSLTISEPDLYQLDAVGSAGTDAELAVLRGGTVVCRDSDSGEGTHARASCRLEPGVYQVRVWEYGARPATIEVSVDRAAAVAARPVPPVQQAGTLALGRPAVVRLPAADDPTSGTRGLALVVSAAGLYRLDATAPQGIDAELAVVRDGRELQRDSDGGEGVNARLSLELEPGRYEVRVWEYQHRGGVVTVTAARQ